MTPTQQTGSKRGIIAWAAISITLPLPSDSFRSPPGIHRTFPRSDVGTARDLFCLRHFWLLRRITVIATSSWRFASIALFAQPQGWGTMVSLMDATGKHRTVFSPEPSTETWHRSLKRTCPAQEVTAPLLISFNRWDVRSRLSKCVGDGGMNGIEALKQPHPFSCLATSSLMFPRLHWASSQSWAEILHPLLSVPGLAWRLRLTLEICFHPSREMIACLNNSVAVSFINWTSDYYCFV